MEDKTIISLHGGEFGYSLTADFYARFSKMVKYGFSLCALLGGVFACPEGFMLLWVRLRGRALSGVGEGGNRFNL
jgi:hypothetical protein